MGLVSTAAQPECQCRQHGYSFYVSTHSCPITDKNALETVSTPAAESQGCYKLGIRCTLQGNHESYPYRR